MCTASLANESFEEIEVAPRDRRLPNHEERQGDPVVSLVSSSLDYLATESSNLRMEYSEKVHLCQYAQAGDRARRLRNLQRTTNKCEAIRWGRPICMACLQMVSSKHWPVI